MYSLDTIKLYKNWTNRERALFSNSPPKLSTTMNSSAGGKAVLWISVFIIFMQKTAFLQMTSQKDTFITIIIPVITKLIIALHIILGASFNTSDEATPRMRAYGSLTDGLGAWHYHQESAKNYKDRHRSLRWGSKWNPASAFRNNIYVFSGIQNMPNNQNGGLSSLPTCLPWQYLL